MKYNIRLIVITVLLIILSKSLLSDCQFSRKFIDEIKYADLVALVECKLNMKIKYASVYKIIEVIKGDIKRDRLLLWGQTEGDLERDYISNIVGDTILIAVKKHMKDFKWKAVYYELIEKKGSYCSWTCGNNSLYYKNGFCTGWITHDIDGKSKTEKMEYEELKKLIIDILEEEKKIKPDSLKQIKQ